MFDIRTLLVTYLVVSLGLAVAWFVVWRSQSRPAVPGIGLYTMALGLIVLGLLLFLVRDVLWTIPAAVAANTITVLALGLLQFAVADLTGQPRQYLVAIGCTLFCLVTWPILMLGFPDSLGPRITLNALLFAAQSAGCGWVMYNAPTLRRGMRLIAAGFAALHVLSCLIRAATGLWTEGTDPLAFSPVLAFWITENILAIIGLSILFAAIVGARLNRDLALRNVDLADEIAERRILEMQLKLALADEGALRRDQSIFIGLVSGEFTAPLRFIGNAAADLRRRHGSHAGLRGRLDAISGAVRRLRVLIETFLMDRQIAGGAIEVRRTPVALAPLLNELQHQEATQESGGRIQLTTPPERIATLGDPAALSVAFGILIDNALKYSPSDKPVAVTLHRSGDNATVLIADKGIGIPARDLDSVGQRFYRASNAAQVPGTGLGLFSAGRIVQLHNGRIEIDSREGEGTRITVLLPLAAAETEARGSGTDAA